LGGCQRLAIVKFLSLGMQIHHFDLYPVVYHIGKNSK